MQDPFGGLAARLGLTRPLAFLDLATTGTSVRNDRIIEIAVTWLQPDGNWRTVSRRVNPGIPIPPEATAIHGITDEDVAHERPFAAYARSVHERLEGCDLAGFGIVRFDLPLLQAEFARAGLEFDWSDRWIVDAMAIYHAKEPRDLDAALHFYVGDALPAEAGAADHVAATMAVLVAQTERYDDLPPDVHGLDAFANPDRADWIDSSGRFAWREGEAVITFGRYEGEPLRQLAEEKPDYLEWVLRQDFPADAKQIAGDALDGAFPEPPAEPEPGDLSSGQ